jgi:Family of unknown function (DUF6788)
MPRGRKTKKAKLTTKTTAEMLSGHVERRMVRCGKPNCKCSRGELHGPYFYHVTTYSTHRHRAYIRRARVAEVIQACAAHRELQAGIRAGRAEYKRVLSRARELFRSLGL